jgi:hypothetical protein
LIALPGDHEAGVMAAGKAMALGISSRGAFPAWRMACSPPAVMLQRVVHHNTMGFPEDLPLSSSTSQRAPKASEQILANERVARG